MQLINKRIIAKEIVILFCSIVLVGLSWLILWSVNQFNLNKKENLRNQVILLDRKVDSLYSTFPKLKIFDEIVVGNETTLKPWERAAFEEVIRDNPDVGTESSLIKLYKLLDKLSYPSEISHLNADGLPVYKNIKKIIPSELKSDFEDMKELRKIHQFLTGKNLMKVTFNEFIFTLEGLPLPPPHGIWLAYSAYEKDLDKLKIELNEINSKIRSKDAIYNIVKWISIGFFLLIYPLRWVILMLMWAVKTLKTLD